jgi:4-hydroxy-tetrahydrodipicolinate reductase
MKIALIGYGKMGSEIEKIALAAGHEITAIYSPEAPFTADLAPQAQVFIDFSVPDNVFSTVQHAAQLGLPVVIGTTGWYDQLSDITALVQQAGIGCLYGGNFSPGIQILHKLTRLLSADISALGGYDIGIIEKHHRHKVDSPGGTALQLANSIIASSSFKQDLITGDIHGPVPTPSVHVSGFRCGHIIGEHQIIADSEIDTITLTHTAKSRSGFARGAVLAAEWIVSKKGMFDFSQIFEG